MHQLYYVAVIVLAGMIMAKIVGKFKLPHVTGYLLAGILIGPSVLNLVPKAPLDGLNIISEVALGFIAYTIGSEIKLEHLKKAGKSLITITLFESLTPVILVTFSMIFIFKQPIPFAITLGAIAAATAPAATIMVIKQYRAKGPLVDTLLPVVAMDDGVAIVAFGISFTIAKSLIKSGGHFSFVQAFLLPVGEILLALILGFVVGLLLSYLLPKIKGEDELLSIVVSFIFLAIGVAEFLNVSTLLVCMMIGITIANLSESSIKTLNVINRLTPPIFIAFFTLAGIELELSVLRYAGLLGLGYIIFRTLGKAGGAFVGSRIAKSHKSVQKYLGFTLLPQAGVAIGLSMIAQTVMPEMGSTIRTIILSSTVIYELVGPLIAKTALIKAGEIKTN